MNSDIAIGDLRSACTAQLRTVQLVWHCPTCDSMRYTEHEECCNQQLQPRVLMETHADFLLGIDCVPMYEHVHGHC